MNTETPSQVATSSGPGHRWPSASALFLTLSLADLGLTWLMVEYLDGASEANPVAAGILDHFGWLGLALHKLGCVALVLGIAAIAVRYRPRMACLVMRVGCGSVLVVLGYSVWLLLNPQGLLRWNGERGEAEKQEVALRRHHGERDRFVQYAEHLVKRLAQANVTLPDATCSLHKFLGACQHDPLRFWPAFFGDLRGEACLAAYLVHQVGHEFADDPVGAQGRLQTLVREYAHYGVPLPEEARDSYHNIRGFKAVSPSPHDAPRPSAGTSQLQPRRLRR
jgi:hypothetical protein